MEICILKFDESGRAEEVLKLVADANADRNPWLHEVGVIARPLVGRVRVGATFPDGKSTTFHEGDLAGAVANLGAYTGYFLSTLAGPLGMMIGAARGGTLAGAWGGDAEQRLFHVDELKRALPRDSSALVLIADTDTCDEMVELFDKYDPTVVRRDVADELHRLLDEIHQRIAQRAQQAIEEQTPANP